ncbi:hypothetical protein EAI30_12165 [Romboutsia ilealis]|uniref:Zinc finger CHC2-type domain-containing protein n=1 Tax=Romboutsia faecis TaxID=2764597 RepID=A0ABR7JRY5_9FIRM|nr:VapE domain-containing protein [Romboutsia faecis]MBC5997680.1 hypothetical protein [Romboutsia faecis]MRN25372.1 hypothetical protein [Romboutsia ilealis]
MYKQYIENIRSTNDLQNVISYYYPNQLKKNKMNCPFHKESSPSFSITNKGNGAFYKCFGCGEGGNVINFIQKVEDINFIEALKKAYEILGRPLELPKQEKRNLSVTNKNKAIEYYEEKSKKALEEGDIDKAFEMSCEADREKERNYYIKFPKLDNKNKPQKVWENLEAILKENKIIAYYNEITKEIEIEGLNIDNFESQIIDIHSLSITHGLNLSIEKIGKFVTRIGMGYSINPVKDYLLNCLDDYEGGKHYIKNLCDALITPKCFDQKLKETLIKKWLLNTASIVFNDGTSNIEGVLTLQGKQGIGKTRLIRKLVPMYVKTGLELDPSDKDKINQCIKYWVVELGELDSTLKKDIAKIKAFITEQVDEFRKPYQAAPMRYPRKTSFYATVNNEAFLKDETGNRRYWVIPVEKIDFDIIDKIDIEKLWGEVMYLKEYSEMNTYLEDWELEMLNQSNKGFKVSGYVDIAVANDLDWSVDKKNWTWKSSDELAYKLKINNTKMLKSVMENYGAIYKKTSSKRGYICPPYKSFFDVN